MLEVAVDEVVAGALAVVRRVGQRPGDQRREPAPAGSGPPPPGVRTRSAAHTTPIIIAATRRPGELAVAVLDEGPGLPPGQEQRLFETFTRLEGSDRSKAGTGLGLAIVKGFAEAMGMSVSASNRVTPGGAAFALHVPEALLIRAGPAA